MRRRASDEELASIGLRRSDIPDDTFEVWPDVADVCALFVAMGTQWRLGYSGPTGFDYTALPVVMQMTGIKPADQPSLFDDLRVMEIAALEQFAKDRPKNG